MQVHCNAYAKQKVANAIALGKDLQEEQVNMEVGEFGFTKSYQLALPVTRFGKANNIASSLAKLNLICNFNQLPGNQDPKQPSRLKLVFQERTGLSMKEGEMI